ncbi:hypothetical protein [Streptacidiphilus cavernicola]|uniref:Uncharacterized protein n=1 Tax=Streptacidiphilus cavernicola TaxID=3342716 RepID=A0ABV6VYN4_9ACTN
MTDQQVLRTTWTTGQIRAADLREGDRVLIDGQWREILDVHREDDDHAQTFGEHAEYTKRLHQYLDSGFMLYIAGRILLEEKSYDEGQIIDELRFWRLPELLTVQMPIAPARLRRACRPPRRSTTVHGITAAGGAA